MLDYTDPEGKISLPRFHGANCITPVFFLQKTRFGNGNKTIAGFQTPAQTALFACSHMPEKPAASFGLFTGARGLEGARPSSSPEQHFLTEDQSSALPQPTTHSRSRKFPRRYRLSPSEEVWRAPGPPVPPSNIFSQKISLPPQSRPHAAGGKRKKAPHRKFRCDAFDSMGGNASETFPGVNG